MTRSEHVAAALDSCADALHTLAIALRGEQDVPPLPAVSALDRLLTAGQAASVLGVTKRWIYTRAAQLPFARHLSRRTLRFSEAGLRRWMERRQ